MKLQRFLKQHRITPYALARRAGVDPSIVYRLSNGDTLTPSLAVAVALEDASRAIVLEDVADPNPITVGAIEAELEREPSSRLIDVRSWLPTR